MPHAKARTGGQVVPYEGGCLEVTGPHGPFCLHRCAPDDERTRDGHGFSLLLRRKPSTEDMCRCMA